jgi:cytochrome c553
MHRRRNDRVSQPGSYQTMNYWFTRALLAGLVAAQSSAVTAEGNVEAGRKAAETCIGCHGVEGYFNVYPSYHVPKIGGQQAGYIAAALKAYRSGERKHKTMQANANNLTDEVIADIAAYFAAQGQ